MRASTAVLSYRSACGLTRDEQALTDAAAADLVAGRLTRYTIGLGRWMRSGKKRFQIMGASECIDARSLDEARACAQATYGDRIQRGGFVLVCEPATGAAGDYGWFRPAFVGPAIDILAWQQELSL